MKGLMATELFPGHPYSPEQTCFYLDIVDLYKISFTEIKGSTSLGRWRIHCIHCVRREESESNSEKERKSICD